MREKIEKHIELRQRLLDRLRTEPKLFSASEVMQAAIQAGNKIMTCGNGGSATQASHFAAELVNRLYRDRQALPALCLNDNTANITSIANDSDFRWIFSRQIEALGIPGDVLLALTTGGESKNILEALARAHRSGLKTICLCGSRTDKVRRAGTDMLISIDATDTPAVQEMHLFLLHVMADLIEQNLTRS